MNRNATQNNVISLNRERLAQAQMMMRRRAMDAKIKRSLYRFRLFMGALLFSITLITVLGFLVSFVWK